MEFNETKTINEIMSTNEFNPKRCMLIGKTAKSTGFTPWYQDEDGFWIGIVRWYGNNNKDFQIDYRDGNKKWWVSCSKMPILPKNHPIRIELDEMEP